MVLLTFHAGPTSSVIAVALIAAEHRPQGCPSPLREGTGEVQDVAEAIVAILIRGRAPEHARNHDLLLRKNDQVLAKPPVMPDTEQGRAVVPHPPAAEQPKIRPDRLPGTGHDIDPFFADDPPPLPEPTIEHQLANPGQIRSAEVKPANGVWGADAVAPPSPFEDHRAIEAVGAVIIGYAERLKQGVMQIDIRSGRSAGRWCG